VPRRAASGRKSVTAHWPPCGRGEGQKPFAQEFPAAGPDDHEPIISGHRRLAAFSPRCESSVLWETPVPLWPYDMTRCSPGCPGSRGAACSESVVRAPRRIGEVGYAPDSSSDQDIGSLFSGRSRATRVSKWPGRSLTVGARLGRKDSRCLRVAQGGHPEPVRLRRTVPRDLSESVRGRLARGPRFRTVTGAPRREIPRLRGRSARDDPLERVAHSPGARAPQQPHRGLRPTDTATGVTCIAHLVKSPVPWLRRRRHLREF